MCFTVVKEKEMLQQEIKVDSNYSLGKEVLGGDVNIAIVICYAIKIIMNTYNL